MRTYREGTAHKCRLISIEPATRAGPVCFNWTGTFTDQIPGGYFF